MKNADPFKLVATPLQKFSVRTVLNFCCRVPVEKGMSTEAGLKQSDIHHK